MKFHISYERSGVYQGIFVDAPTAEVAETYFQKKKPDARVLGVHLATRDDEKPGKPVMSVPEGHWTEADDGDGVICSECGEDSCTLLYSEEELRFCPYCHAYMV